MNQEQPYSTGSNEQSEINPFIKTENQLALDALLQAAADTLNSEVCFIKLRDKADPWISTWHDTPAEPFSALVLNTRTQLIVSDTLKDNRFRDIPELDSSKPIRFFAGFPVCFGEASPNAVLCILDYAPHSPTGRQLRQLSHLVTVLEGLLIAAQTVKATAAAFKTAEDARAMAEREHQLLEKIADVSGFGGWEYDLRSGEITWTAQTRRIHEVGPHYAPDLETAMAFYESNAREKLGNAVNDAIKKQIKWDLELPFTSAKGRSIWVQSVGEAIMENGETTRLIGAFRDITEERRKHRQTQHTNSIQMAMFGALREGILLLDKDGLIQSHNPAAARILGHADKSLVGQDVTNVRGVLLHDRNGQQTPTNIFERAVSTPEQVTNAVVGITIAGSSRLSWIKVNASPVDPLHEKEVGGVVISLADISEAQHHADNLKAIFRNFPGGVALFDESFCLLEYNDQFGLLLDIPDALLHRGMQLADLIHHNAERGDYGPGDPAQLAEQYLNLLRMPTDRSWERSGKDGAVLQLRQSRLAGTGYLTTILDITKRKGIEVQLKERERVARQKSDELRTIVDNMSQGVSVFNNLGELTLWNDKYVEICQKPPGDIFYGVTLKQLIEAEQARGDFDEELDIDEHIETLMFKLESGEVVHSLFRHADGRVVSSTHAPLPDGGWIGTHEDVTARQEAAEKIEHAAYHDTLTGLANRTLFTEKLMAIQDMAVNETAYFAVMLLDLDRFKPVNDTHGHDVGDILLKKVADRLTATVRTTDTVARLGGDEFAIVLSIANPGRDLLESISSRIVDTIRKPYHINGITINIGISVGVSWISHIHPDIEEALKKADTALYEVKKNGRNGYLFFKEPEIQEKIALNS
ncbi:MAG: PAS-domain containing protein [Rhodobacteraceae bacterium]|nr:PAS-domain containing protein [Paracoccaceae bacterium]